MNSSILADIEETLSDEITLDITCKCWYWNEFLPKIDEDNIRNEYRLVYQEFSKYEWMSLPYNYPEHAWEWLLENKIMILSHYSEDTGLYGWYDKYDPILYRNVDDCYKYRLTDKFFEDYQKNVRERRKLTAMETWMDYLGNSPHRLYSQDKTINDLRKYSWPLTYKPII